MMDPITEPLFPAFLPNREHVVPLLLDAIPTLREFERAWSQHCFEQRYDVGLSRIERHTSVIESFRYLDYLLIPDEGLYSVGPGQEYWDVRTPYAKLGAHCYGCAFAPIYLLTKQAEDFAKQVGIDIDQLLASPHPVADPPDEHILAFLSQPHILLNRPYKTTQPNGYLCAILRGLTYSQRTNRKLKRALQQERWLPYQNWAAYLGLRGGQDRLLFPQIMRLCASEIADSSRLIYI